MSRAGTAAGPDRGSRLHARRRAVELDEATDGRVVDLLVVGLGVTGTGVALDAASRGLDVIAVDAQDLAFGTSRWSSKLAHGGLRYLAHGQVGVAYESAYERGVLMSRTAPHLVHPLAMVIPLLSGVSHTQAAVAAAGLHAGDLLRTSARTRSRTLPRSRRLTRLETLQLAPGVRRHGLRGGLLSWDGQLEDDARLVVALARTAAAHHARILTRCRVLELHGDGAVVRDELTGRRATITARAVINATGVWAADLVPGIEMRPSRGTHLVLRKEGAFAGLSTALSAPVPGETSRYVFALPQSTGLVYVGLTDEPVKGPIPDVAEPTEGEIDFLLDVMGEVVEEPLTRLDVVGSYSGLRPLVAAHGRTADLSRRHVVLTSPDGVVSVFGGKLTTYRRMAQDAVDTTVARHGLNAAPCSTTHLPLVGAVRRERLGAIDAAPRLVARYGSEAPLVAADRSLLTPIATRVPYTHAELQWALTHEGALDVDDLLDRRTRVGLVPADRAEAESAAHDALAQVTV